MIERFKALMGEIFSEPKAEPVTHELELAAASLLIDVARADFHCSDRELAAAARELEACFGFDASESRGLLGRAVERHEAQTSLYPFVKLINEHDPAGLGPLDRDLHHCVEVDPLLPFFLLKDL